MAVQITLGEFKSPWSDEFVLVGGHQDSWEGLRRLTTPLGMRA